MRRFLLLFSLLGCFAAAKQQPTAPLSAASVEPVGEVEAAEQEQRARCALKRVHLLRMFFLVQAHHLNTPEHDAECLALARRLQAPAAYIKLLEVEAAGPLSGRDHYEHNEAVNQVMIAYGVDALAARLLAERLCCNEQQARELTEWLPMDFVFNVVPRSQLSPQDVSDQLAAMRELFERMQQEYSKAVDRESADAAANDLLQVLSWLPKSAPLRLIIGRRRSVDFPGYSQIVLPAEQKLNEQRKRLIEADFYGSKKLNAMDQLLCL